MQHRQFHRVPRAAGLLCLILSLVLLFAGLFTVIRTSASPADDALDRARAALDLPDALTDNPVVSYVYDWSAIAYLNLHPDTDLSSYRAALRQYVDSTDLSLTKDIPTKLRIALVFSAIAPEEESEYIQSVLTTCAGTGNIMNYITGLFLADSRHYAFERRQDLIDHLLSIQLADGGWALTGSPADTDITAMALTALAPHKSDATVAPAVQNALSRLRALRRQSGGYASYGVENAESASQVCIALCALGLDPDTWFDDGLPALTDVIRSYALDDGSFSHVPGGTSNAMATYQAYMALTAHKLLKTDGSALYDFDAMEARKTPAPVETEPETTAESGPETGIESETEAEPETEPETASESETETEPGTETDPAPESGTETASAPDETDPSESESSEEPQPETDAESAAAPETETPSEPKTEKPGATVWKWVAAGAILLCGGIAILALALTHHLTPSRWIPVVAAVLVLLGVVLFAIRFESVDDHFHVEPATEPASEAPTVTIDILCYNALSSDLLLDLPQDGIMLKETKVLWQEGMSVWDVLDYVCRANGIVTTHNGDGTGVYVTSIGGLYEMDCGDLSGWVYVINGTQPSKGCGTYILEPGDTIHWVYSVELGRDVKEGSYDWTP
ncbi:MAG: DUF4430 domain-containing protein [Clostridia bacterium]|nr:DUF4430 domain-containing protein [Clostridia bacterium]